MTTYLSDAILQTLRKAAELQNQVAYAQADVERAEQRRDTLKRDYEAARQEVERLTPLANVAIDTLSLSFRTRQLLHAAGIHDAAMLLYRIRYSRLEIPRGIGKARRAEIDTVLEKMSELVSSP